MRKKMGFADSASLTFARTAEESVAGDVMTRIYSRRTPGVVRVERKAPPKRSSHRKEGRRDLEADSVQLGFKEIPEDQIYGFLSERISYHLGVKLEEPNIELGSGSGVPGFGAMSSESLAVSILSFATSYFNRFKRDRGVSGEEARGEFAKIIMTSVDEAAVEVLDFVWEQSDLAYEDVADCIERFLERAYNILCDFIEHGPP